MQETKDLKSLQNKVGYEFSNIDLLKKSLIHRSYGNEHWEYRKINNERLELLGDAVLDLIVTEYLYKNFNKSKEGELAKLKSMIVSEPILAQISRELGIGEYLLLSKGEELTGGRERSSILGDVFESLLGAIYLDSDFDTVKKVALKHLHEKIDNINQNEDLMDYKTILQEYSQRKYKKIPVYEVVNEIGPDHRKNFEIIVKIKSEVAGSGIGKNKKSAEQLAAKNACKKFGVKINEAL